MVEVVDFLMMHEINELLREKHIPYSVHSIGGCAACGLVIQPETQTEASIQPVIDMMNTILKKKWLMVIQREQDPYTLDVVSTFVQNPDHNLSENG